MPRDGEQLPRGHTAQQRQSRGLGLSCCAWGRGGEALVGREQLGAQGSLLLFPSIKRGSSGLAFQKQLRKL